MVRLKSKSQPKFLLTVELPLEKYLNCALAPRVMASALTLNCAAEGSNDVPEGTEDDWQDIEPSGSDVNEQNEQEDEETKAKTRQELRNKLLRIQSLVFPGLDEFIVLPTIGKRKLPDHYHLDNAQVITYDLDALDAMRLKLIISSLRSYNIQNVQQYDRNGLLTNSALTFKLIDLWKETQDENYSVDEFKNSLVDELFARYRTSFLWRVSKNDKHLPGFESCNTEDDVLALGEDEFVEKFFKIEELHEFTNVVVPGFSQRIDGKPSNRVKFYVKLTTPIGTTNVAKLMSLHLRRGSEHGLLEDAKDALMGQNYQWKGWGNSTVGEDGKSRLDDKSLQAVSNFLKAYGADLNRFSNIHKKKHVGAQTRTTP